MTKIRGPRLSLNNFKYPAAVYFFICAVAAFKMVLVLFVQVPDIIGALSEYIKDETIQYLTREIQMAFVGVAATMFGLGMGGVYFMRLAWLGSSMEGSGD